MKKKIKNFKINKNNSNEVQSCNLSNIGKVKIIMKIIYSFIKKCNLFNSKF